MFLNSNKKFLTKAMAILTSACVLVSIFTPILNTGATDDFSLKVSFTKSVDKTTANPGEEIVYTINYKNDGTVAVRNVVIRDPLENAGQEYLTFIGSEPSSPSPICYICSRYPGQFVQITFMAQII